jgi:peptidoglycan/xylan/chitin deacetylase (PgdA/CDA1 family)
LTALAGSLTAVGGLLPGVLSAARATAAPAPDPSAVATVYRGRTPTQFGMSLPGIASKFAATGKQIALTFDACNGACDDALLSILEQNAVPAVLFLNARWIDAHPDRAARVAASPWFEIGNHGTRHMPLSVNGRSVYGIDGTRSSDEAVSEVWTNHTKIALITGKPPAWFRAGTAHYDDVAVDIVNALGLTPVGFSVNADNGAKLPAAQVTANIVGATPGAVVLAHMNHPQSGTAAGVRTAITAVRAAGGDFVSLAGRTLS